MSALIASVLILLFVGVSHASEVNLRIINGVEADNGEFPFAVSIQFSGQHICGASIISEYHILTAAHCFSDTVDPSKYSFVHGDVDLETEYKQEVYARRIIVHEDFDDVEVFNDIALIELSEPLQFDEFTNHIGLPNSGEITEGGTEGTVIGWGENEHGGYDRYLLKGNALVLSKAECFQRYRKVGLKINNAQICGDQNVGSTFCTGDSGGPLIVNGKIIGIVSWSLETCRESPDVYTEVSQHIGWIADNTGLEIS